MATLEGAVLPKDSLILVTGANGLVGSHVVDQLLRHGYKVRASVRDTEKSGWLSTHADEQYGKGRLELAEVKDLTNLEAMKKAMAGCAGCVATASDVSFGNDPKVVITAAVNLVKTALEAAAATPSIKRFVMTSSSAAATPRGAAPDGSIWGKKFDLGTDSYDEAIVEKVWAAKGDEPSMGFWVYGASKVMQEKEAWKFMAERKPSFVLNTVLPDFVGGKIINQEKQGYPSSMGLLKAAWDGDAVMGGLLPPQYEINVADTAMLHMAGLLHPDAKGERIFGFASPRNLTETIRLWKELYPQRKFMDPPANEGVFEANIVGRPRAEELLRWVKGSGWTSYKDSLKQGCDGWV